MLKLIPRSTLALALFAATTYAQPPATPAPSHSPPSASGATLRTENIFLIMADGLRWQEVFTGADHRLMNKDNGVKHVDEMKAAFWRDSPEQRREALLPFLWHTAVPRGQIYGNLFKSSDAHVANACRVSYPGYSETFCGFPNEAIKDNRKVMNPETTAFEWLNGRPGFESRVAAFGTWDLFTYIFNVERSGLPVDDGMGPLKFGKSSATIDFWNRARAEIPYRWSGSCFDAEMFRPAFEWVQLNKPRVVFLGLGETDEWAHEGNYEEYLKAANRVDGYVRELWEYIQSAPEYKDKTSIILLCDHGRGGDNAPNHEGGELKQWRDHNSKVVGAEQIWIAIWGPDTPALGERRNIAPVTQSQVASTLAALLGQDYRAAEPRCGPPLSDALPGKP